MLSALVCLPYPLCSTCHICLSGCGLESIGSTIWLYQNSAEGASGDHAEADLGLVNTPTNKDPSAMYHWNNRCRQDLRSYYNFARALTRRTPYIAGRNRGQYVGVKLSLYGVAAAACIFYVAFVLFLCVTIAGCASFVIARASVELRHLR